MIEFIFLFNLGDLAVELVKRYNDSAIDFLEIVNNLLNGR